jgi:hypothetical protein
VWEGVEREGGYLNRITKDWARRYLEVLQDIKGFDNSEFRMILSMSVWLIISGGIEWEFLMKIEKQTIVS